MSKRTQKKSKQNFMDFVPVRLLAFETRADGVVEVIVPHTGLADRVAQRVFRRPAQSHIALDEFGSFLWSQIDGERNVYALGLLVRAQFGERAEPLFERLSAFLVTLCDHRFICWEKEEPPCTG